MSEFNEDDHPRNRLGRFKKKDQEDAAKEKPCPSSQELLDAARKKHFPHFREQQKQKTSAEIMEENKRRYFSEFEEEATNGLKATGSTARDASISQMKVDFKRRFEAGEISTRISLQKQQRHIKGSKEFEEYVERLRKSGKGNNLPSYIREDLKIQDLERLVVAKLKGNVVLNPDGSFEEYVMCNDIIGYYYSPSQDRYIETRCVKVKYSLGKNNNIHIVPVKEMKGRKNE